MKITIVTVCFNSEKTIFETMKSVQTQSYKNLEHIIVDGHSTDNTINIVKNFSHVTKIISEKDCGIYDAMNKGIALSQGDVIGFLNSDDTFYDENSVKHIMHPFLKYSYIDIIYGDLNYIDDKNKIIRNWTSETYIKSKFLYGWSPPHPTFYTKKKIFEKYGNFNQNLGNPADFELMYRMMYKKNLRSFYLNKKLVNMKVGGISNKSLKNIIKQNLTIIGILKENKDFNIIKFIIKKILSRIKQYTKKNSL